MEKDKRLIRLYEAPDIDSYGISGIIVDNITIFQKLGKIIITLTGSDSLNENNRLGVYSDLFSQRYRLKMLPRFLDINEDNINERVSCLTDTVRYLARDIDESLFGKLSGMDLRWNDGTLEIGIPSGMFNVYDDGELARIEKEVKRAIEGLTSVDIKNVRIVSVEDTEDEFVNDSDAFSNTAVKYYRNEAEIEEENVSLKQQVMDKFEKEHADLDKNSWEYKAKLAQETAPASSKEYKYEPNSSATVFGRVKEVSVITDIDKLEYGDTDMSVTGLLMRRKDDKLKLAKSGKSVIARFIMIDKTGGVGCVMFLKPEEADAFESQFEEEKPVFCGIQGSLENDKYSGEPQFRVNGIFEAKPAEGRHDNTPVKRVELHCHTTFSEKDATSVPSKMMKLAASFGHRACAVTDHGVVQAFPEVYNTAMDIAKKDTSDKDHFKSILGCEGYLVDDGKTVFFNLPFNRDLGSHVGSFTVVTIRRNGKDPFRDTFTAVSASKYRLKGYVGRPPYSEGETDEDAMAFVAKDVDKSLWDESEIPENLSDEALKTEELSSSVPVADIRRYQEEPSDYSETEIIPEELVYEHVSDFYAEFEDSIFDGGEVSQSYFVMGELLDFIADSYVTGPDIFSTLAFLRRAGFGIDVEKHVHYKYKFNMPVSNDQDIIESFYNGDYPAYEAPDLDAELSEEKMFDICARSAELFISMIRDSGTTDPYEVNEKIGHKSPDDIKSRKESPTYHIIYLVRNYVGLYGLYNLVSESHVNYFSMRPRTPKSLLRYWSSGLIIGGACERGEIYRHVLSTYKSCGKDRIKARQLLNESLEFKKILSLYDYVEIQPLCNNIFLTRQDPSKSDTGEVAINAEDIRIVNELLVETADDHGMMCCATCDAHYLEKDEGQYRKYIMMDMGFKDAELQSDLYFRTTEEMLAEFTYLGEKKAEEVVITNTNKIADMIDYGIKPFPDGTYPPMISHAATDVRDITYTRANKLYRHNGELNPVVKARIEKELGSIIGNGFAIMYYIAYRLVKKSNNDGYIVGSRGSVGSSFVATMCGISEVNPLPPHYRCPKCNYAEFDESGNYGSGYDLPDKACPCCGEDMKKDGQDIPFETFLGFKGDKQPDIDLNFSSEYQPRAHKYVEYLFGLTHTFRAGTVASFKDKNALMVVRKICEERGEPYTSAKLTYMSYGIVGVKRTTGQHPGGIVVIPKEMDIYDFTPIQCPANKTDLGIITTHFDFNAMHDTILKLDILGHADPTMLRMLYELTDIDVTSIPIPQEKVMSLLKDSSALELLPSGDKERGATLGLPELGTPMARGMIEEAKPTRFYDLVQLMGLSHGTDVWAGNAQDLIRSGTCDINTVIGCRDSIMTRLIYWGLPNKDAFDIMENVRKGKVAKGKCPEKWEAWKAMMKEKGVPDWYIESCQKIKYMFPKAHAAAYSISSLRIAWFKVFYPVEYYCAYYTIRAGEFDAYTMCFGKDRVVARRKYLEEQKKHDDNPKIKDEALLCELVEEMYDRGISFAPITLDGSDGKKFLKVDDKHIRPPFAAIDSISESMGMGIAQARDQEPFKNREDFTNRSGIGQSATQVILDYGGIIDDLPESAQMTLFDFFDAGGGGF